MALFTDGAINSWEMLRRYESSILDVASGEGIELTAKLDLAAAELAVELSAFLFKNNGSRELTGLVVTEPLAQWHALQSLAMIYRDAYSSQLNDRFKGKWTEYVKLATRARDRLWDLGLGLVNDPVPCPRSVAVSEVEGGAQPESSYHACATWVTAGGIESAPSVLAGIAVPAGRMLAVESLHAPANAAGWNVYAGAVQNKVTRQNGAPLPLNTTWICPAPGPSTVGASPGTGQQPDFYATRKSIWTRI